MIFCVAGDACFMKERRSAMAGRAAKVCGMLGSLGQRVFGDRAAGGIMTTACAIAVAVLLAVTAVPPLYAQTYPNKPIRLILPFQPGGTTDIIGRIIGQKYAERFGQPVVPENRPGAGSNLGIELAAKAKPDGYTMVLTSPALTVSPGLYKKLNYDPVKDLAPISMVVEGHYVLVIRPALPIKNLKELVAYAKANPGKLNYGSGGIGTAPHLAGELLKSLAKIDIVHVPYKGANLAMTGVMAGEVDMVVIGITNAVAQIQAGKVRGIAVLSNARVPSLPDIPTAKEAGIDNFEVTSWYGLLAPAGTPRDIISRLNAEWAKIATDPDTKEKMEKAGFETVAVTPEQFSEFINQDIARWGRIIKEANLSVD
jgi:tripartite-type tricarboxylate transporter receptor subunit TctC